MSDGLTDVSRDQERGRQYSIYTESLLNYLKNKSKVNYKKLIKDAENVDGVRGGYFGSRTNILGRLEEHVKKLTEGDERAWAILLNKYRPWDPNYQALKEMSPFKEKTLALVDYGVGFVNIDIKGFEDKVSDVLRKKNLKTYDCDDYMLILPKLDELVENSRIIWLRCGILGMEGPRTAEGKRRRREVF